MIFSLASFSWPLRGPARSVVQKILRALLGERTFGGGPAAGEVVERSTPVDPLAQRRTTGEQIDGRNLVDELVRPVAPRELARILVAARHEERDAGAVRPERLGVRDVQL